jgi:chorismate lyase/3-hydroxybenzoate synthase
MCTARIEGAVHLDAASLQQAVAVAYRDVLRALEGAGRHPIRFWNFVPSINDVIGGGLERYMVFNAGRFDAYSERYGAAGDFGTSLATASAVGVTGSDLVIHSLAADVPGEPIENPRQAPSWTYSSAHGPRPPCFARATRVAIDGRRLLLIGGTASIVGEQSLHRGDLAGQVHETLTNLERLVSKASAGRTHVEQLTDVRVYVARREDVQTVAALIEARCAHAAIDVVTAGICRPELLVEVEGIAAL